MKAAGTGGMIESFSLFNKYVPYFFTGKVPYLMDAPYITFTLGQEQESRQGLHPRSVSSPPGTVPAERYLIRKVGPGLSATRMYPDMQCTGICNLRVRAAWDVVVFLKNTEKYSFQYRLLTFSRKP